MKRRLLALGCAGAVGVGLAGVVAVQPADADPHRSVLHLRVVPVSDVSTAQGFVAANDDYNSAGEKVGSDVTTCRGISHEPETALCDVGLALGGGLLQITFTMSEDSDTALGRVVGGTGEYRDVRGSVVIHELGDHAEAELTLVGGHQPRSRHS